MKVEIKDNEIVIILPLSRQPSKSGKTVLVASTHGGQSSSAVVDGKPVIVSVNAYISK